MNRDCFSRTPAPGSWLLVLSLSKDRPHPRATKDQGPRTKDQGPGTCCCGLADILHGNAAHVNRWQFGCGLLLSLALGGELLSRSSPGRLVDLPTCSW